MKFMSIPVRFKNPWFWITLGGVILTAMGVSPEMFTSWDAVVQAVKDLVSNPFMLGSVAVAVLGVLIDPTTSGVGDSQRALSYKKPEKSA